jgi:O-antigen/teichoic acid export membrane protein
MVLTATDGLTAAVLTQAGRDKRTVSVVNAALLRVVTRIGVPVTLLVLGAGVAFPSQRPLIGAALAIPFALYVQGTRGIFLAAGAAQALIVVDAMNSSIFGLLLIPLLAFGHLGAYQVLAFWVIAWMGSATFARYACRRLEQDRGLPKTADVRTAFGEQLQRGMRNGGAMLAGYLNLRIDVFLVSAVLGARELGLYTLAIASAELLWGLSLPVVWSTLDRVAGAPFAEAAAFVVRVTRNVFAVQIVLGVIAAALGPTLIALVYGSRFAPSGLVLQLLIPGTAIYAARSLMGYFILVRLDRPFLLMATQTASALLCAAISFAMFPVYGIAGAAIATSVTYTLVVIVLAAIFCRATGTRPAALLVPTRDDLRWYGEKARSIAASRLLWKARKPAGSVNLS